MAHAPGAQQQLEAFRFLDLCAELRNNIYSKVLEDYPTAHLSQSTGRRRKIASDSTLSRVSKQVRDEFLGLVATEAPVIETTVTNFHFGHLITYLNNLPDFDLGKMTAVHATRILRITLEFDKETCKLYVKQRKQLRRWLNRAMVPAKKGSTIDFQYTSTGRSKNGGEVELFVPGSYWSNRETGKIRAALALGRTKSAGPQQQQ